MCLMRRVIRDYQFNFRHGVFFFLLLIPTRKSFYWPEDVTERRNFIPALITRFYISIWILCRILWLLYQYDGMLDHEVRPLLNMRQFECWYRWYYMLSQSISGKIGEHFPCESDAVRRDHKKVCPSITIFIWNKHRALCPSIKIFPIGAHFITNYSNQCCLQWPGVYIYGFLTFLNENVERLLGLPGGSRTQFQSKTFFSPIYI